MLYLKNIPDIKDKVFAVLLGTPLGLASVVGSIIAGVELLIMLEVQDIFVPAIFSESVWGYVDTALLTLTVAPVLYFLVFRKMQASMHRTQMLLDSAMDGIISMDHAGKVIGWNPQAEHIFGYSYEQTIGRELSDLIVPLNLREAHRNGLARFVKTNIPTIIGKRVEITGLHANGSEFPVELTIASLNQNGALFFTDHARDISEKKKNEDNLIAARDEADRANQAKSLFLSSMSHELRTPLNAILGFGQLLELESDSITSSQHESVTHILSAGHHLLGLVNQMLDLTRIDIDKWDINTTPLNIEDLVSNCVAEVATAIENKGNVTIENTITDTGLWVQGDNQSLRQVVINLLSNAVNYNEQNGLVTISSVLEKEGRLRIEVRDTGAGIASDKLPLLFTPFERIDQRHGTISGVGIGLHISKRLIEMMQGTIGVESVEGNGSTFWFDLPLAVETNEPTIAPRECKKPILHKYSHFVVLYIEDNATNVKLVERALHGFPGIELLVADTAEEGITIAEEKCPDLILMDIQLPGIDGITATTLLKGIAATKHIPVVALSADAMKEDIDRALNAGCSGYLTKPIDLQALYEMIASMRLSE